MGPTGVDALDGLQGPSGPTGPQGCNGNPGPRGNKGDPGITGPQGPAGHTGPTGPMGAKGPMGPCECPTLPYARYAYFREATVQPGAVIPFSENAVESHGNWRSVAPGVIIPPEDGVYLFTVILSVHLVNEEEESDMGTAMVGLNLLSGTTTAMGALIGNTEETVQIFGYSIQRLLGGAGGTEVSLRNYSNGVLAVRNQIDNLAVGAAYTMKITKLGD